MTPTTQESEARGGSCAPAPCSAIARDMLQTDWLAMHRENQRLRAALERILGFPVHSEPVGGAYAMQDIAREALSPNAKLSD